MSLDSLPGIVTLLIALSVATERAVEIVKSLNQWLNTEHADPGVEGRRRAILQVLAVGFGIAIAALTWPVIFEVMEVRGATASTEIPSVDIATVIALGLLASGGSGFWNSMLTYVTNMKELKKAEVREHTESAAVIPHPATGTMRS